jgi:hypothetical protein
MTSRAKFATKCVGAGCVLVMAAGVLAPYLGADRYAGRIRSGLESALGRRVEIGKVRFNLFTGPGFSVSKVVIFEDLAFGREPFAYVESLEARPRLWPLITGRLEFASLRLEDTSVNLTRVDSGPGAAWNFSELLRRTRFDALPALHLRTGRINFKFGDNKSVFYVTDADLDISPPAGEQGGWRVQFSGQAARTDRRARGFGFFTASGAWRPGGKLDLDIRLEKSAMNEMIGLVYGRDIGVHGGVSARAHIAGPLADLHINGALNVEDIHRWDLLPEHGTAWPFEFEGRLNIPAERLEIDSHSAAKEAPPLAVRFRAADYLSRPHWGVAFNWNRFRVEPLLQLARHLGANLPDGLKVDGSLDGAIGYSEEGSWQGQLAFQDAAVTIPGSPPVSFEHAALLLDGGHIRLPAAVARTSGDDLARIEAAYELDNGRLELAIETDSMAVAGLQSQAALAAVPILEQVQSGVWKGKLTYQRQPESPGQWSGAFQLEHADIPLPSLAEPLRVQTASVKLDGARVSLEKIELTAGDVTVRADYHYEPGALRPHRVRISTASLDAAELERLLMPTLKRTPGLIARTFGFGRAPAPEWLRNWSVEGSVAVDSLRIAGLELQKVRARLFWNGTSLALGDVTGSLENGSVSGRLLLDLRGNDPAYRLAGRLKSVEWNGGTFDAEATLNTIGTGDALLSNLRSQGSFNGQSFDDQPLDQLDSISGCYALEWAKPAPHLRFTDLQISSGGEVFLGRGAMQSDGRLLIQVSNGARQLNMSGTLASLRIDDGASQ